MNVQRKIKFRVWDSERKTWKSRIYDYAIACYNGEIFEYDVSNFSPDNKNLILEQYTGLKDKNGKEIYENDLLKINDKVCQVMFYDFVSGWIVFPVQHWADTHTFFSFANLTDFLLGGFIKMQNSTEIIGNVHENPELLKL